MNTIKTNAASCTHFKTKVPDQHLLGPFYCRETRANESDEAETKVAVLTIRQI